MGNVYTYSECSECGKLTDSEMNFIVHGSDGLEELGRLSKTDMPIGKIAHHFCGYCGGYVALDKDKCGCGCLNRQGWQYPKDDERYWGKR
jgi:hypothetical protein